MAVAGSMVLRPGTHPTCNQPPDSAPERRVPSALPASPGLPGTDSSWSSAILARAVTGIPPARCAACDHRRFAVQRQIRKAVARQDRQNTATPKHSDQPLAAARANADHLERPMSSIECKAVRNVLLCSLLWSCVLEFPVRGTRSGAIVERSARKGRRTWQEGLGGTPCHSCLPSPLRALRLLRSSSSLPAWGLPRRDRLPVTLCPTRGESVWRVPG
jgi:hypothetical protein